MNALLAKIKTFVKDEEGLTVVEYAVAGGLIAAALIVAFTVLGDTVFAIIANINNTLSSETGLGSTVS